MKEELLQADPYQMVQHTSRRDLSHIPGVFGPPILGITPRAALDFDGTMREVYRRHGPVAKASVFFQRGLLVNGAENAKRILLNPHGEFSTWSGYSNAVARWFGKALILRDGRDHLLHKRIVLAAFSQEALKTYARKTNVIVSRAISSWDKEPNFVTLPHLRKMLVHIAANIFYGLDEATVDADTLSTAFTAMLEGTTALFKIDQWPFRYRRGVQGKKVVRDYLKALIPLRNSDSGTDLMSHMVRASLDDQPPNLNEEELIDHLSLLFFAGYDTTTTSLIHMLMHLGMDQSLQETLREESRALGDQPLELESLEKLTGINNVFQEALRLYPAAPMQLRGTTRECELGGYKVPANTLVIIPPIVNHTSAEYWSEPMKFDPARFGKGREEHKKNGGGHYHPFGGGAHMCIGARFATMNAKLFTHQMLLRYRFKTPPNYAPRMVKLPMPKPADGLPLTFTRV